MTDTTPTPAVGQIWQDNDPRGHGRRIRLDRFRPTSTGYRHIGQDGGAS